MCTPRDLYCCRIDGRSFTKLTKQKHKFKAPFDDTFRDYMVETTNHLMKCGFNAIYGFTITKGHAKSKFPEETEFISYNGGGIYCYNANLKLFNMSITHNSASEPNSRGNGGGLYIDSAFVLFDNVHLLDNYGLNTGGAFYCKSSTLKIYNSLIDSNSTYYGGAPISIFSSVLDFRNVLFMDNENRVKLSPDFIIYSSDGVFEDVKTINDSVYFKNSAIKLINCEIPYQ